MKNPILKILILVSGCLLLHGNGYSQTLILKSDSIPVPIYEDQITTKPKLYLAENFLDDLTYYVEILDNSPLRYKVELCISIINNEAKNNGEYYYHIVGWVDKTNCAYVKDIVANPASANNGSYRDNKAIEESRKKLRVKDCIVLDFTSDSLQIMSRDGETLKIEWINNPKTF